MSVTIIARDEADRIGAAIQSVAFADEVVVLDCGSTDDTVAVAERLGARVVHTDWPGFVAQKNRAVEEASHDWVLGLDADERVGPVLAASIRAALGAPSVVGFAFDRLGHWMGAPIHHGTWRPDRAIRLFDRRHARWVGGAVHERVRVDGKVQQLDGDLLHDPYRDLGEHLATIRRYADLFVEDACAQGRRAHWWDVVFRPPAHFFRALVLRAGFLDGIRGWCIACLGAAHVLLKWGQLYLVQMEGRP